MIHKFCFRFCTTSRNQSLIVPTSNFELLNFLAVQFQNFLLSKFMIKHACSRSDTEKQKLMLRRMINMQKHFVKSPEGCGGSCTSGHTHNRSNYH